MLASANAGAMQVFLDHFTAALAQDVQAVMVLDGAGWHVAHALEVPENITLVLLPPYCPELNPVERIWLYLKERFLSLRIFESTEEIIEACCRAWNRLANKPHRIKSLSNYPWITEVSS